MRAYNETSRDAGRFDLSPARSGSRVLRDLRAMNVCIFHPLNRDGELLAQQLERIGCKAHCFWPPLDRPVQGSDLVFIGLYPDTISYEFTWSTDGDAPPVVAVVNYENPTIIDAVLRVGAKAVVASPVRSFGVLSAVVLAKQISCDIGKLKKRVLRLEERVDGARRIAEAQEILARQRGITMLEAYRAIRAQAMTKRVPIEDIASAIVAADEVLSMGAR
jgi:AmiR/NasT family two-component response regulator